MMKIYKVNLGKIRTIIVEKDFDWLHLIIGKEGIGKTTLAIWTCLAIDPTFNATRIVRDLEELKRVVRNSKQGQAILIDEGALFFFAGDAMTREVKETIKLFTAIRTYNLFICICVPNYYDIVSRIRDHRVKSGCRVVKRGWFWAYSRPSLNRIKRDKKHNREIFPEPDFRESFPKYEGKIWNNYIRKKQEIMQDATKSEYISTGQSGKILGVSRTTILTYIKQGLINARRYNKQWRIKRSDILDLRYQFDNMQNHKR